MHFNCVKYCTKNWTECEWNAQFSVWKTIGKDSSEACAIACQNCAVYSVFPTSLTSQSKIAEFNWECIAPFTVSYPKICSVMRQLRSRNVNDKHHLITVNCVGLIRPSFNKLNNGTFVFFILIPVPCIFYYFVQWPTNGQSIDKLSHSSYMFRHYCVILREFVVIVITCQLILYLLVNVQ